MVRRLSELQRRLHYPVLTHCLWTCKCGMCVAPSPSAVARVDTMSTLMAGYECEDIALENDDFPWRTKGSNPDDYIEASSPMQPEFIFHHVRGKHNRLWLRVSWKLGDGRFVPMSFLLDTGAPKHLYLSEMAMTLLEHTGLTGEDEDTDVEYTQLFGRKCLVELVPNVHQPANIIGLKMLKRLGLRLFEDEPHFAFDTTFSFFSTDESGRCTHTTQVATSPSAGQPALST